MRAKVQNITSTRTVYYYESRVLWINNARILACFVVVLLHVSAGVVTGIQNTDSAYWWIGNVFDSLSRWCIPVFVMISGMLLLDNAKDEPLRVFYRKRLSRILVPLLFWTLFYLLFRYFGEPLVHGKPVSILTLAGSVLNGVPYAHLWYLYMLVGLYLLVPFLRKIAWHSTRNELLFLCSALFALSILGEVFISYYFNIDLPATFKFIFYLPYFLAGYLISRTTFNPSALILGMVFILSVALTSVGYHYSLRPDGTSNGYFYQNLSITVAPMSISIMFLLKRFRVPIISPAFSDKLALLSLGVYLIHPFFLELLNFFGLAAKSFNPLSAIPSIAILIFILASIASLLISKITLVNKIIGLRG
jgi:surface polysaccharide O-acyltransferase-like enzyme